MSFSIRGALLCFYFLASSPLFLTARLIAQEIILEPQVGFHGLFRLGYPFPLRVDISNLGRPVEGSLEVTVWKRGPPKGVGLYPFYYKREIFLSARSRKSVQFTVDPDSLSRPLTISFSSSRDRVTTEVDLRRHFSPAPLILLLTESNVSLSIPLSADSQSPVVSLSLEQLPSDARAYQGVSAIIFYEQSLRDLSKSQVVALEAWLSSGGRILVLGGMQYALYQEPAMSRLLPVRVRGLKRVSSLPSLEKTYGKRMSSRGLLVQDASLVYGRVMIEEKGTPILVEMTKGKGKVLYVSLDVGRPPVSRWEGLPLLFRDLLGSHGERTPTLQANWDEAVFSQLLLTPSLMATYAPARPFLVWVVLYLGGLGLLAWFWRTERLPRRALVAAFFCLFVFATLGGYFYFDRGGHAPDGVLVSSTILESLPDGYVEVQSTAALFSTRRRHYDLRIEAGWTDLELGLPHSGELETSSIVIREDGRSTRFRVPFREWDYRLFKMRSMNRFPVRAEVQSQGNKLFLELINEGLKELTDCWLVISGQPFSLGNLPSGSRQIREFPLSSDSPSEVGRPNNRALREIPFNDKIREVLFRYSIFPQDQEAGPWSHGGALLLFGWVKGSPSVVEVDDVRVLAHHHTLFRRIIPLAEAEEL